MCLIIFSWRPSLQQQQQQQQQQQEGAPDSSDNHMYELVVTANRDEAYDRPTVPARFWSPATTTTTATKADYEILSGQDKQAGGTWLGVDRQKGRFAAVTNFWGPKVPSLDSDIAPPEAPIPNPRSRGLLAVEFLSNPDISAKGFMEQLVHSSDPTRLMNGFSLIVKDDSGMFYYNNRQEDLTKFETLQPGIVYGLSNGFLNSDWPKVRECRQRMTRLLKKKTYIEEKDGGNGNTTTTTTTTINVKDLRDILTKDDVGRECCRAFIKDTDHGFGTVSNAVVIVRNLQRNDHNHGKNDDSSKKQRREVTFSEHMFDVTGATTNAEDFQWQIAV